MQTKSKYEIVVVESRWVFVRKTDGSAAACIRNWGTEKGLGEIALGGPTKATVLDPCGVLHVADGKTLFTLECNTEAWDKCKELN